MTKPRLGAEHDDAEIARMCAWLKRNGMVAQATLSGRLKVTPKDEAMANMLFNAEKPQI